MLPEELDEWLIRSFEDHRLSRSERQSLGSIAAKIASEADRQAARHRAFEIARQALSSNEDRAILDWLEDSIKALRDSAEESSRPVAEAYFSPGDACPSAIARVLTHARRSVDVCVFTITDDRLADALIEAHHRGVAVRVLTDDAKAEDLGSDIDRIERSGVPVRVDRSPFHMHHKFAIAEGLTLLTGSYNWTRGAARDNQENLVLTDDPRLVSRFSAAFERLWSGLG